MPYAPKKPCLHPGCPALIDSGSRCEEHRKEYQQRLDRSRGNSHQRGYDADWRRLREAALKRDNYLCQKCLAQGRMTPANIVDHRIRFHGTDDPRRLDLDNLESMCKSCHSTKTA